MYVYRRLISSSLCVVCTYLFVLFRVSKSDDRQEFTILHVISGAVRRSRSEASGGMFNGYEHRS